MKKDLSKLRPFDLEAAKRGEAICDRNRPELEARFIAHVPDIAEHDRVIIKIGNGIVQCSESGECHGYGSIYFAMAPLCWVEGNPVYKGDVLYSKGAYNVKHQVDTIKGDEVWQESDIDGIGRRGFIRVKDLTWTPPKVKRNGFVLLVKDCGFTRIRNGKIYDSEDEANAIFEKLKGIESVTGVFPFAYEEPVSC